MKKKKKSLAHFVEFYLLIPLFFGIGLQMLIISAPSLDVMSAIQANGVYPDPEQYPDGNLPIGTVEGDFLSIFMKIILAITSTITLVVLIVSGTLYIINFGDEEKLNMAKSLLNYAIIGVIVIVIAYSIIAGVANLRFGNRS